MEFHIAKNVRDKYQFDQIIYALNGNVIFANFHAARIFTQKMNQKRDLIQFPEQVVRAGQVNALGLIDEILHLVIKSYRSEINPLILKELLLHLDSQFGKKTTDLLLFEFCFEFPPVNVYTKQITIEDYLAGSTEGVSHRENTLEELILLWVTNRNPAAIKDFQELFDEKHLINSTKYGLVLKEIYTFFNTKPSFGPDNLNLIDMLRAPALASPNSLTGQLDFIRSKWGSIIGKYLYRLLSSLDFIKEEEKLWFSGFDSVETHIPTYSRQNLESEIEQYSADKEWMPRLVLMAKNTLVWLDQLGKKYQANIQRLDQIPDEELDHLVSQGFTGLWLIGLWERSPASARIKQMCGNPDAVSSAYSLTRYEIASEIGGYLSYDNLRHRAWIRGIRLASDMVPNHMGIDSDWVMNNPDRFLSLPYSPYPSYSFEGPDLSPDPRVEIKIEDHYYNRTDAAVVFRRVDRSNGNTRFIYHGNDGTSMPWNDTAQLNYLNPEAREAIIQTILDVAHKFPIIRFDAAMTLARKHVQRLWFPEPGSGGDIPSRADHSLSREDFLSAMPQEFWREVVDRVAREAPDTLLLAEAFWLMEGYFVRTLGMHRVYNSAFMNMLRNEENAKFRQMLKNTLEYDPEILRRYVNFISNPDERTAVDQFGKGDKYFGTCTLMATLPGLPMFGHGQIEGLTEKYGMEYKRAYYDEIPDEELIHRHEREIFPLLKNRSLFAGVEDFYLFDFFTNNGPVDENVIAYTNGLDNQRVLVAFHNKFSETTGWVRVSAPYSKKSEDGSRHLAQTSLVDALSLKIEPNSFVVFRNQNNGLEYIRPAENLRDHGLFLHLQAYSCCVFEDFSVVSDDSAFLYRRLCDTLNGQGVPSLSEAIIELLNAPALVPLNEIMNTGYFQFLDGQFISKQIYKNTLVESKNKMANFIQGIAQVHGPLFFESQVLDETVYILMRVFELSKPISARKSTGIKQLSKKLENDIGLRIALYAFAFLSRIGKLTDPENLQYSAVTLMEEWKTLRLLQNITSEFGLSDESAQRVIKIVRTLIELQGWTTDLLVTDSSKLISKLLANPDIQGLMKINRYHEVLWYSKEGFEDLMDCLILTIFLDPSSSDPTVLFEKTIFAREILKPIFKAHQISKYQVECLLDSQTSSDQAS